MPIYTNALAPRPSNSLAYGPRNLMGTQMLQGPSESYLRQQFPGLYGFLGGVTGTEPSQMGGSVLDPNTAAVRQGAEYGFPISAALDVLPFGGPVKQGTMALGRAGERLAERAVPQIMQRGGLGADILQGLANRTISPLDVYHGTPHTLPPTPRNPLGEFDASKIGTGEGAQAYGHGLYFAENPAVAKEYQVKLSNANSAKNLADKFGGVDQGIAEAQRRIDHYTQLIANGGGGMPERAESFLRISQKNLRDLQDMKAGLPENKGSLYKVDLPDEKIAKMLDYDKHLSEQSSEVQNILLPYQKEIGSSFGTGEQTLKAIAFERRMKGLDDSPAAVAQQLKEMGIPGVQYLDEKSRGNFMIQNTYKGQPYGEPVSFMTKKQAKDYAEEQVKKGFGVQEIANTRNFVVFPGEEKSMTILERNGQPAPASVADQIDSINEIIKKKRKK